uniref:Uncharacterized protein n=1 Tax=Vespula pensylvanica TaxID=30213 RepID=A0A834P705_VESPE|nr:hypothetical protein H0235_006094 [Vespula pensylvanica]
MSHKGTRSTASVAGRGGRKREGRVSSESAGRRGAGGSTENRGELARRVSAEARRGDTSTADTSSYLRPMDTTLRRNVDEIERFVDLVQANCVRL